MSWLDYPLFTLNERRSVLSLFILDIRLVDNEIEFPNSIIPRTDLTAGGFGLSYAAMDGTDTRSELGARFDGLTALNAMPLILRAKAAWAHDWVSNPARNASFESLPGASFTVYGAPIPYDSALTSAGAQLFFTPNWSLLAKFDGEFVRCGNAAASKRGANLPAFVGEERSYCATTSAGPVSMLKAAANRARV